MMAIKTKVLAAAVVAVIFGGIAVGAALDVWQTTSSKEPAKIATGAFAGKPNPADIRGSYTWSDVAKAYGIPESSILAAFGSKDGNEKVNTLEGLYGGTLPEESDIGTDSARLFAALYAGLPYEAESSTILPASAIAILRSEGKGEKALIEAAAARAPGVSTALAPNVAQGATKDTPDINAGIGPAETGAASSKKTPIAETPKAEEPKAAETIAEEPKSAEAKKDGSAASSSTATEEHASVAGSITGKTTFYELEQWGFDMAKVEGLLGGLGPSSQAVRDYCSAKGLSFSEMKTSLQALAPTN
jgi:hypothetical protein